MDREKKAQQIKEQMPEQTKGRELEKATEKLEKENRFLEAGIENLELRMKRDEIREQFNRYMEEQEGGE